jgi:hypothetical protein
MVMPSNQTGFELGWLVGQYPGAMGHLYSPGAQRGPWPFMPYALDNGAFPAFLEGKSFDFVAWRELLNWARLQPQRALWAAVPDVVADREGTLRNWGLWVDEVRAAGLRPTFVAQDGMTFADVPTADCVVFLGGSTEWKEAAIEPWCRRFPGRVHVGRVNKADRLLRCYRAGAISVDGTGWWHKKQRAELMQFLRETHQARRAA